MSHVVIEFGKIKPGDSKKISPGDCIIPSKAFNHLKTFITEENDFSDAVDKVFRYSMRGGVESIIAKNYVGIIETKDGTILEILPKIFFNQKPDDKQLIDKTRAIFRNMIAHLKDSPVRNLDDAHINNQKLPLLETFISAFIEEFEILLKRGIKQSYQIKEENLTYFKSRLLVNQNIKVNLINKAKFYIEYEEYQFDNPQNRILKSTLKFLERKTTLLKNKTRIINYLTILDEIPESCNYESDFSRITSQNRLFFQYTRILGWAKIFLLGNSFTTYKGKNINRAILFPMEKIFESYVSDGLQKYLSGYEFYKQDKKYHLIDKHDGQGRFGLIPDIVLRGERKILILDTKWKLIDENQVKKNYLINSSDMYQMFAYAEKYSQKECFNHADSTKTINLYLLYPRHDNFTSPLKVFVFHEGTIPIELQVLPVNLDCNLRETINQLNIPNA